jgi:hypothetical protein
MKTIAMQILEDGHWIDVETRAKSFAGMRRVYRALCKGSGPNFKMPSGYRIFREEERHLGVLFCKGSETLAPRQPKPNKTMKKHDPNCPICHGTGEVWVSLYGDSNLGHGGPFPCNCEKQKSYSPFEDSQQYHESFAK